MPENEYFVEFIGAGFIAGHPGMYANCRVVLDTATHQVLRIEPLGGATDVNPIEPADAQTSEPAAPIEPSTNQVQSNGG